LIRDTGKGVQQSDLDKLFEPFNRLEYANSNVPGTGIGLTICKQLIELMDGQIGVHRNPDQGLTFWLEFKQA
jgi:signal transduction histidine kinase